MPCLLIYAKYVSLGTVITYAGAVMTFPHLILLRVVPSNHILLHTRFVRKCHLLYRPIEGASMLFRAVTSVKVASESSAASNSPPMFSSWFNAERVVADDRTIYTGSTHWVTILEDVDYSCHRYDITLIESSSSDSKLGRRTGLRGRGRKRSKRWSDSASHFVRTSGITFSRLTL
jgi:hypothetical protein